MAVNKVVYGDQTLIDISDTTAVASDVMAGKYFYGNDGVKTLGTGSGGESVTQDQDGYIVLPTTGDGGSGGKTFEMKHVDGSSSVWGTLALPNSLPTGGKLKVEIYCPSPNTDYDNIIGIGTTYANMQNWTTSNAVNFYLYHQTYDTIVVRQSGISTYVANSDIDMSIPHTIEVDKDYIYVDGVQIVATSSDIVNSSVLYIGANQGSKRYLGHFNSITFD